MLRRVCLSLECIWNGFRWLRMEVSGIIACPFFADTILFRWCRHDS